VEASPPGFCLARPQREEPLTGKAAIAAAIAAAQTAWAGPTKHPELLTPDVPKGARGALARAAERLGTAIALPAPEPPLAAELDRQRAELEDEWAELERYGSELADKPGAPPDEYPAAVKRPPLDTRTRKQRKQELAQQRAERRRDKFIARMAAKGISPSACPPECPMPVYQVGQAILSDWTGIRTVGILEEEERARSGFALGRVRDVLGGALDLRCYEHREVIAAFVVLQRLAVRVERKGEWCYLVRGFSLEWLRGVLHFPGNPSNRRHRSQLGGGGRRKPEQRAAAYARRWGELADPRWVNHQRRRNVTQRAPVLQRLRDGGVLYAQQMSWDDCAPWERDTRGEHDPKFRTHTRNRYWLRGLNLGTLRRARSERSRTKVAPVVFDELLASFQAMQAYGSEWVRQLRAALEHRRDNAPAPG
jgi:hypothetical protein